MENGKGLSILNKNMKIGPRVFSEQEDSFIQLFQCSIKDLSEIVETYRQRKLSEEIQLIDDHGGLDVLIEKLKSDKSTGLSTKDSFEDRVLKYGKNKLPRAKDLTYLQMCWEALNDKILRILLVSGIISLILGAVIGEHPQYNWIEGFSIIVAIAVVINVTAINDLQKQKKFKDLKKQSKNQKSVNLLRDGLWQLVHPKVLVVGDIVKLENGVTIPADGILIHASSVEVVEAAMTGENENIKKLSYADSFSFVHEFRTKHPEADALQKDLHHAIPSPVVLSGTNLAEGVGTMIVIAVGCNSAEGKILELSEQSDEITPLMKKLNRLAIGIGNIGIICAVVTVLALYIRFAIVVGIEPSKWSNGSSPNDLVSFFIIGITVLVVAIPEGLPLAVTISLAYSVKKMQKENNFVRKMHACETMGGANMICSDKTGTLTQNKMTVNDFWAGDFCYTIAGTSKVRTIFEPNYLNLLKETIFLNSSAYFDLEKGEQGSKSEIALLLMMENLGHTDYKSMRLDFFKSDFKVFPFSSKRKRSSVLITKGSGLQRLHVKGASETVVLFCEKMLNFNGDTVAIDLPLINSTITKMTEKALRVLALAYKDIETSVDAEEVDSNGFPSIETSGLTLIGLAGIRDPIRDEVPAAVKKCQKAGITIRMVTGDNKSTAKAIAKECFIITSQDHTVMEGKEFAEITGGTVCSLCRTKVCPCPRNKTQKKATGKNIRKDVVKNFENFKEIVTNLAVLARSAPDDKYTLVTGLKEMGNVVAVTGDGTNDAPALKKADIGFAMGIAGTEMAKEAADIILMDDNFNSIVRAVVWGRNIYDNIRCFLQFQLTVNVVAVISAVVGAITIQQSPLTSVQLLWVNLIMDSLGSLALATDPPTDDHLERKPYNKNDFIIEKSMWKHILGQAFIQIFIIFSMMYAGENFLLEFARNNKYIITNGEYVGSGRLYELNGDNDYKDKYNDPNYGPSRHFTYIFNVFVLLQLGNEINCRKLRDEINVFQGIHRNWLFVAIWIVTFGVQILVVQVGSFAFSCNSNGLTIEQWLISIGFGLISIFWRFFLLLIPTHPFPQVIFN